MCFLILLLLSIIKYTISSVYSNDLCPPWYQGKHKSLLYTLLESWMKKLISKNQNFSKKFSKNFQKNFQKIFKKKFSKNKISKNSGHEY